MESTAQDFINPTGLGEISRYWIVRQEGLGFTVDLLKTDAFTGSGTGRLTVVDCDGQEKNTVELSFKDKRIVSLDSSLLMGDFRKESGMTHGQLIIETPDHITVGLNLFQDGQIPIPLRGLFMVRRTVPFFSFLPKHLSSTIYFGITNIGKVETEVQCRLYYERFYREIIKKIPAHGARVFRVEEDFREVLDSEKEHIPKYIRISQKSEVSEIGVQVLEQLVTGEGERRFFSVS